MDSNKKSRPERARTPAHLNASEYQFKGSASKRFSPNLSRRPALNETVGFRAGLADPKIKTKLSTPYAVNYETECDIAYNDYLQALMKRQIVRKKIADHKEILEEQMLVQQENLRKRSRNLEEIVNDTETFGQKREIVEMIDFFQQNMNDLKSAYEGYDMQQILNLVRDRLHSECEMVILKQVKGFGNQQEYDKFIGVLESCLSAMEKIINSGRDFTNVHELAEKIRTFFKLREAVVRSQENVAQLEKKSVYTFLSNLSDFFAKKYANEISE